MELDLFRGVVPFVAVAEEKSFRRAAARLGVSPAAVSKAIQVLETALGVCLMTRNARSVTLTSEGELLLARCLQAVTAVQGARTALDPTRQVPRGELVVSAPSVVTPLLAPAVALLRARHPGLTVRWMVTDRLSRLGEEGVDVAVRVGTLPDSTLVARRLRRTRLVTVASPAYLHRQGTPARVDDLAGHSCLVLQGPNGKPRPWLFTSGPRPVPAAVLTDHGPALVDAALAGLGVAPGV